MALVTRLLIAVERARRPFGAELAARREGLAPSRRATERAEDVDRRLETRARGNEFQNGLEHCVDDSLVLRVCVHTWGQHAGLAPVWTREPSARTMPYAFACMSGGGAATSTRGLPSALATRRKAA